MISEDNKLGFALKESSYSLLAKELVENLNNSKIPDLNYSLKSHTFHYQTERMINFWKEFYGFEN